MTETTLDADLRIADPDRWISSRFVSDAGQRKAVVALYALDNELARVRLAAGNPLAAEIRLGWWLEELEGAVRGGPVAANPILQTLARTLGPALPVRTLERIVEGRRLAIGNEAPADEAALVRHFDDTSGAIMIAAASVMSPDWTDHAQVLSVGRAWGWSRVARGLEPRPADWADASATEINAHLAHRIADAMRAARSEAADFPTAAFPAIAYATLAPLHARGRAPSELESRARITVAVLRGRV